MPPCSCLIFVKFFALPKENASSDHPTLSLLFLQHPRTEMVGEILARLRRTAARLAPLLPPPRSKSKRRIIRPSLLCEVRRRWRPSILCEVRRSRRHDPAGQRRLRGEHETLKGVQRRRVVQHAFHVLVPGCIQGICSRLNATVRSLNAAATAVTGRRRSAHCGGGR